MATVPYIFANQSGPIPLAELDSNFSALTTPGAGSGASYIGFLQNGANAVPSNLQQKAQQLVTVGDFGATGLGIVDDSGAFLGQQADFDFIVVPPGTYKIATSIAITVPMWVMPGALIEPSAGVVFTVQNAIQADDYQIFSNAQSGTFALSNQAASCRIAWFGVSPQGTAAANTAAFTLCMASMPGSGCHVIWPAGAIQVNNCVHSLQGVWQQGHAAGTALINNTTANFALEQLGNANFNNKFTHFHIGQASGVTAVAGNGGVHVQGSHTYVTDIDISGALYDGIYFDGSGEVWFERCSIINVLNNGVHFANGCGDIYVNSIFASASGANGYFFDGCLGLYGQNLNGYGNHGSCFQFGPTNLNNDIMGSNWVGDTSGGPNWNVQYLQDSSFSNCWSSSQLSTATNPFAPGLNIIGANNQNLVFTNQIALTNNGDGILVDNGASNIRIIGASCRNNGKGGQAGALSGIAVGFTAAANDVTIIGSRCSGNAGNGILLGAFASNFLVVSGCNTQGNTGTGLVNNATGGTLAIGTGANL